MPVVKDKVEISSIIRRANEQIGRFRNDRPQQFPTDAKIGDGARQGDFYFTYVDHDPNTRPMFYRLADTEWPRQLVDGTSKGSRHILSYATKLWLPVTPNSREMYEDLAAQWDITDAPKLDLSVLRLTVIRAEEKMASDFRDRWFKLSPEERMNENGNWRDWRDEMGQQKLLVGSAEELLAFSGPIFYISEEDMARRPCLTHPEHADWYFIPGCYRATYQRTVAKDNTFVRVLD